MTTATDTGAALLRVPDVLARLGISRMTLWRMVQAGRFPAPVRVGERIIAWRESEVHDWIEGRERAA